MRKIIVGNWKMHGDFKSIEKLLSMVRLALFALDVDVIVCPSFVYLSFVHGKLKHSKLMALGAQDVSAYAEGAYTGEVAASMLKELGCNYVIIGHSECRQYYHETNETIAAKVQRALDAKLIPILCIGETKAERDANKTKKVLETQLTVALQNLAKLTFKGAAPLMVAYEPVWAIGADVSATQEQIADAHEFIRKALIKLLPKAGTDLPILYGGSVKAKNAAGILRVPQVAGALVGGASINAGEFIKICEAAQD
jgi:triosephosphate isomerase (TIM)